MFVRSESQSKIRLAYFLLLLLGFWSWVWRTKEKRMNAFKFHCFWFGTYDYNMNKPTALIWRYDDCHSHWCWSPHLKGLLFSLCRCGNSGILLLSLSLSFSSPFSFSYTILVFILIFYSSSPFLSYNPIVSIPFSSVFHLFARGFRFF